MEDPTIKRDGMSHRLKVKTKMHPALMKEDPAQMISSDLLGQSPDIKKFSKRKMSILNYMDKMKEDEFTIEPQFLGSNFDLSIADDGVSNAGSHYSGLRRGFTRISRLLDDPNTNERRTLLRTREVDDNIQDFLKLDIAKFRRLKPNEAAQAYKQLRKSIKPVFSGDVDPLVNMLDFSKVKAKLSKGSLISQSEMEIIEQLTEMRGKLDEKEMMMGLWDSMEALGSTPDSREGARACLLGSYVYVFGGFSRDLFKEVRYANLNDFRWKLVPPKDSENDPGGRYNHTMCAYADRYLVVFGGAGQYLKSMSIRQCLSDLFIFDSQTKLWSRTEE